MWMQSTQKEQIKLACSYSSSSRLRGSFKFATCGSTTSQRPWLMSEVKPSMLSTVFKDTWHSFCRAAQGRVTDRSWLS